MRSAKIALAVLLFLCLFRPSHLFDVSSRQQSVPVLLFFAPHKSGSSLIQEVLAQYALELKLCHFRTSFEGKDACFDREKCFSYNDTIKFAWPSTTDFSARCEPPTMDMIRGDCLSTVIPKPLYCKYGFIWGAIRYQLDDFQQLLANFASSRTYQVKVVYHIRNPLDQLVSEYFSFGFIHNAPVVRPGLNEENDKKVLSEFLLQRQMIRNMTVDEYVLRTLGDPWWWNARYGVLLSKFGTRLHKKPYFVLSRYEDMVEDFPSWIRDLNLSWADQRFTHLNDESLKHIVARFSGSSIPDGEHKLFVHPGSSLKKLNSSTLRHIHQQYGKYLRALGYSKPRSTKV
eukprot:TRINITY_DN127_c0_g1_i11.p1 TRINITY_DN127_c0_g1~~TRINITY_DN127_c0_g1_i11.p1  ORF type:complete len:343 (+),score=14.55 TRINITY_DN127_c0_g1_i11:3038-4066(+)